MRTSSGLGPQAVLNGAPLAEGRHRDYIISPRQPLDRWNKIVQRTRSGNSRKPELPEIRHPRSPWLPLRDVACEQGAITKFRRELENRRDNLVKFRTSPPF